MKPKEHSRFLTASNTNIQLQALPLQCMLMSATVSALTS